MRGEDGDSLDVCGVDAGSPPHARGRLGVDALRDLQDRITPACAGKTLSPFR